jgi:hypothetical protein
MEDFVAALNITAEWYDVGLISHDQATAHLGRIAGNIDPVAPATLCSLFDVPPQPVSRALSVALQQLAQDYRSGAATGDDVIHQLFTMTR